jgi:hypothetical protein
LLCVFRILLIPRNSKRQAESALLAVLDVLSAHHIFAFFPNTWRGRWTIHDSPRMPSNDWLIAAWIADFDWLHLLSLSMPHCNVRL